MFQPNYLIVDGKNLLYRAAWSHQALTHNGRLTGGIFGFLRVLLRAWDDFGCPTVQVCWEGNNNWRFDEYPAYKANRAGMRESSDFDTTGAVDAQLPRLVEILRAAGVKQAWPVSGECDDALFTMARNLEFWGEHVAILSQDRDLYQAVSEGVVVLRMGKDDEWEVVDREGVVTQTGVAPIHLSDLKALAGDPSDNVPGAKGIGPKTAAKLLGAHHGVEAIVRCARGEDGARPWGGTPRQRQSVLDAADMLPVYEKVLRLHRVNFRQDVGELNPHKLGELLDEDRLVTLSSPEKLDELCALGRIR